MNLSALLLGMYTFIVVISSWLIDISTIKCPFLSLVTFFGFQSYFVWNQYSHSHFLCCCLHGWGLGRKRELSPLRCSLLGLGLSNGYQGQDEKCWMPVPITGGQRRRNPMFLALQPRVESPPYWSGRRKRGALLVPIAQTQHSLLKFCMFSWIHSSSFAVGPWDHFQGL